MHRRADPRPAHPPPRVPRPPGPSTAEDLVFDDGTSIPRRAVTRWLRGGATPRGKKVLLVFGLDSGPLAVPDTAFNDAVLARATGGEAGCGDAAPGGAEPVPGPAPPG